VSRLRASQLDAIVLVVASLAGATAWISLGALAVTSDRLARLGVLPPLWTLPVLVIGAALAAIGLRLRRAAAWPLLSTLVLWLPWLPLGVASAFLIWDGPLEAIVWVAALTGVAAASIPATLRERWAPTLTAPRGAAAFAAVALVGSLAAAAVLARTGRIPGGDEPHYLIITQSLLNDGDLRIQNNHDRGDYYAYFQNGLPPDFLQRGVDGQIYSVHAPGISMLLAPAFALGGYPASVLVVALVSAVGLAMTWYAAFSLTGSAAASWMSGLAVLLSGTVFFHSFAIFPDPIGGAIVAAILLLIVRMHVAGEEIRRWHVVMAGVLLAMMPWLHTRFAFVSLAAALVIAGRLWRRADRLETLGAFAAAPLISSGAWFGYFYAIYGTPNPSAPYGDSQQNALAWIGTGLTGLSVDHQFGVLAGAPVIVFVPFGLVVLSRLAPRLVFEVALIALPYVLVVASFGMWWGGWSAPARFLDCLMPLAAPALAFAWLGSGRARRGVFVAAVLVAAANVVARLTVLDGALLHNNRDGFDLLFDWISRSVDVPLGLPSVHRSGAQVAWQLTFAWTAVIAIVLALLSLLVERAKSQGVQWALTSAATYLVATVGLTTAWQLTGAAAPTPASSQADLIRRWNPAWRPLAVQLPAARSLDLNAAIATLELRSSARSREITNPRPLLAIPWVPAGDYRVAIEGASQLDGVLTVSVGMTSQPVETWRLEQVNAGITPLRVRLPALAHSVVIRGDESAARRIVRMSLRPERIEPSTAMSREYIVRASRYGTATAFFLDDEIYVEPAGLWTRGEGTAQFFLSPDAEAAAVDVDVQAGPVQSSMEWSAGGRPSRIDLAPGERRRIQLPRGLVTLRTRSQFRPVDLDPGVEDRRRLGVRLEFPGPALAIQ
jgi:hypothetical protein